MNFQTMQVTDILPAPYNPRDIPDDVLARLKRSIEEFGYVEPIVVNLRTMHAVGGNQRLKALTEMGIETVPVVTVDLPLHREKALNLALNKIVGNWNFDKLGDLIRELNDEGEIDLELTGFSDIEIEAMLNVDDAFSFEPLVEDDDDAPAVVPGTAPADMVDVEGRHDGRAYVCEIIFTKKDRAEAFLQKIGFPEPEFKNNSHSKMVQADKLLPEYQ